MAHDVFISYSSRDKPTADAVCARLEARGVRCWIAPRDIAPGQDYGAAIVDAIEQSRAMVLVFSSGANESQQIKREVERAVHNAVTIIPLRIEDVVPSRSLEYFISTPHWLDAMTPPLERHLDLLVSTLQNILQPGSAPAVTLSRSQAMSQPSVPPRRSRSWAPALAGLGALSLVVVALLQSRPGAPPAAPVSPVVIAEGVQHSTWKGQWADPRGTTYDFTLDLDNNHGSLTGHITWILRRAASTSGSADDPVGSSAIEKVSGHYNAASGEVELTGTEVSAGTGIAMDSYRFTLARNGRSFEGKSLGHSGTWDNAMKASLVSGALTFGPPAAAN